MATTTPANASTGYKAEVATIAREALYPVTADETAAGITPTDYNYPVGNVLRYGADPTGVINSQPAFSSLSDVINEMSGGTIVVPYGHYTVGAQSALSGAFGENYSYAAWPNISIAYCTKPVIIEGFGSVLKFDDGLHIGSFDPVTGLAYEAGANFVDYDYKADMGHLIGVFECTNTVSIRNFELDGNLANADIGGQWGIGAGRQCSGNGLYFSNNVQVSVDNIHTHHCPLDGVYVQYTGNLVETAKATPHLLTNVKSEYNARNGMQWSGGTGLTCINCNFNYTGNGGLAATNQNNLNIEPNGSDMCRDGTFINCEFLDGAGISVLIGYNDAANMTFTNCKISGTSAFAMQPDNPSITFIDCIIIGAYTKPHASTIPEEATQFIRCLFTDEVKYGTAYGTVLSFWSGQTNVLYDGCVFNTTKSKPGYFNSAIVRNCTFNHSAGTGYITDTDPIMYLYSATLENVTINDLITVDVPTNGYYLQIDDANKVSRGHNRLTSANDKINWYTYGPGRKDLLFNSDQYFDSVYLGYHLQNSRISVSNAPYGSGTWAQGDIIFNSLPTAGGTVGWVCTTGGTPGTWKTFGTIEA